MNVITDSYCTQYAEPGHPERPARVSETIRLLQQQIQLDVDWFHPGTDVDDRILLRAHSGEHLKRLREASPFDGDTPWFENIDTHARQSVAAALMGLDLTENGSGHAFSLMRPPGHHAGERVMGFCYLNQAAIVALEARQRGRKSVAVFDFDVHHGNGTEEILMGEDGITFYSVHQFPCYPGSGGASHGNCLNYPVPPGVSAAAYRKELEKAIEAMKNQKPDCLIISAGFDAYRGDPLADGHLELEDFHWLGEEMASLGLLTINILEGGYSADLPELILNYCDGLDS
jgi:acetoin utilization deacetylase AcuC-like enzyme